VPPFIAQHGQKRPLGIIPSSKQDVEGASSERAEQRGLGDAPPEKLETRSRAVSSAFGIAIDENGGVHGACGRAGDTFDLQPGFLEQAVEYAPGEGSM
jgi:hypothetical protein